MSANGPVPSREAFLLACPFPEAFSGIPEPSVNSVLARCTDRLVSAFGDRAIPPILSWDASCEDAVCALAARRLMAYQGYSHQEGADIEIRNLADEAEAFRKGIMDKTEHPVYVDSHSGPVPDAPRVLSSATSDAWVTRRRWAGRCCR